MKTNANAWKVSTFVLMALFGVSVATSAIRPAAADQAAMQAALNHLGEAKASLQNAIEDKAGHRAKAMQLVDQATSEVHQGIAAGAK